MMTIPMDNMSAPSSRELVQNLFSKNIELENKRRKSAQARIPSDPSAWQQMRENYEAIILEDHAFSEQHEVEYLLWQLHYRRIEELRAHFNAALAATGSTTSQGGKGPARPDRIKKIRSHLKTFLSEATGFYHDMILKIRAKYGLPLGHFSEDSENHIVLANEKDEKRSTEMKKGMLSCHRCLIYLGDLARYKGLYGEGDSKTREYAAASSYYLQAASLWPSSGNPHHQLAILASYAGDDLLAVYRYFRSLAVNSPFSTARDNLIIAFEKNRQSYLQLPGDAKASSVRTVPVRKTRKGRGKGETLNQREDSKVEAPAVKEKACSISETYKTFCIRFVRLNGILFTRTSLETFGEVFSMVGNDLHDLLSSGPEEELNFGSDAADNGLFIVRLIAILIFTVHNVKRETEGQSYAEILQRSVLLQNAFTAAFEFVAHILGRCTQLHDPSSSYLLPGILVFVEWLACHLDIAVGSDVEEKQASARSLFWNRCITFLNKLMSSGFISTDDDGDESCFFNMSRYDEGETGNRLALWEDFELRGFLPLLPAQLILDFSRKHSAGCDGSKEKRARVQRILAAGRALVNVVRIDQQGVYFDQKSKKFVIGVEPQISEDFMLTNSSDMTSINGMTQEDLVEKTRNFGVEQPNALVYPEVEEDDEVIVFQPTVVEKLVDVISPKLTTYQVLGPSENPPKAEWPDYVGSISAALSNVRPQNSLDVSLQPHSSFANLPPHHLPPISSGALNWPVEDHTYLANGMKNLSIAGNGLVMKDELQQGFASFYPPFSSTFPQFANLTAGSIFSGQSKAPDAVIPSKFDSIMSSGANADSLTVNTSLAFPASSKKNPVSRPVRHLGPPPGFSPVRPKPIADEFMAGPELKNEILPLDDYTWLDGYQLSSSTNGTLPNSTNNMAHLYPNVISDGKTLTDTISFPFPGKQDPTMQVQTENWKSKQDYYLLGLKRFQEQQQQLQQANQHYAPQQENQGQSMWSGNFFVHVFSVQQKYEVSDH
ncbi:DNA/RNA-binding domain [Macleaya cordata]|uniref:DNA/RNA-binding domain n=1 Tax=Macleaya cordata TaxID=56857 RepID=A0A200PTK3_MACCD|nr:DNA/RNA-binding domain [Macleaya cordata]